MPWTCASCGGAVEQDTTQRCPACDHAKTSWTLDEKVVRRLVVGRLDVLRARGRDPAASEQDWLGADWSPAASAPLVHADGVDRRQARGLLPAPGDLLLVRTRAPDAGRPLVVSPLFEVARGQDVEVPPARAADGQLEWRVLLVRGAAQAVPGAAVIDVSEETPLGHAPRVRLAWSGRTKVLPVDHAAVVGLVELEDARFRTDSAMPRRGDDEGTVSPWATCLRRTDEREGERLVVAGHADTTGSDAHNLELSELRADAAHALLVGDRERWVAVVRPRHAVADVQELMAWLARELAWPCDPGPADGAWGPASSEALRGVQRSWNAEVAPARGEPPIDSARPAGARSSLPPAGLAPIAEDGVLGPQAWRALFDGQELALRRELGVDEAGIAALRARLEPLDPERPHVGCGEHHPLEAPGQDGWRSQTNRRVELVLIGPAESTITLPCHEGPCDPARCDLYDASRTRRVPIPPMASAKAWSARWADPRLLTGSATRLLLDAPGLPEGTPARLVVEQEDGHVVATLEATAAADGLDVAWTVAARQGPPVEAAALRFVAHAGGRVTASPLAPHEDVIGTWEVPSATAVDGDAAPAGGTSTSQGAGPRGWWQLGGASAIDGDASPSGGTSISEGAPGRRGGAEP